MTTDGLVELCVSMAEEFEQALALGVQPDASWREGANCKGVPSRYWETGPPSSAPRRKPVPGDSDWAPSANPMLSENALLSGYKCHVAMGLCGACDVRLDCGLAAVDEEPLATAQHLIRGGIAAQKRGELMRRHKAAVAARPTVLYKRKCRNDGCSSIVGSHDPEVLLCFKCRMAPGERSKAA